MRSDSRWEISDSSSCCSSSSTPRWEWSSSANWVSHITGENTHAHHSPRVSAAKDFSGIRSLLPQSRLTANVRAWAVCVRVLTLCPRLSPHLCLPPPFSRHRLAATGKRFFTYFSLSPASENDVVWEEDALFLWHITVTLLNVCFPHSQKKRKSTVYYWRSEAGGLSVWSSS